MKPELQGVISDWLNSRKVQDADGYAMRSAAKIAELGNWNPSEIEKVLLETRTDLFKRNHLVKKKDICGQLAKFLNSRFSDSTPKSDLPSRCRIALFAANPDTTDRLALDEEIRSISEKIRTSKHRDNIDFTIAMAARPDDLLLHLNEHKADIVHFSGHGTGTDGLHFHNNQQESVLVSTGALKALFRVMKGNIRLVVLNACYSDSQAAAITEEIDCVVAMNDSVDDLAARIFAASFYRAIGFGESIQNAFEQGKTSLLLDGLDSDENIPVLLCKKGVNPKLVILVSN